MQKLNIAELLRGCPKGTRLYSPILGEVTLVEVHFGSGSYHIEDPVEVEALYKDGAKTSITFSEYGEFYSKFLGECLLFPSRDHRTWDDWNEYKVNCLPKAERPKTYREACKILGLPVETYQHPWLKLNVLGRAWNVLDGVDPDEAIAYAPRVYESKLDTAIIMPHSSLGVPAMFQDEETAVKFGEAFRDLYLQLV